MQRQRQRAKAKAKGRRKKKGVCAERRFELRTSSCLRAATRFHKRPPTPALAVPNPCAKCVVENRRESSHVQPNRLRLQHKTMTLFSNANRHGLTSATLLIFESCPCHYLHQTRKSLSVIPTEKTGFLLLKRTDSLTKLLKDSRLFSV